MVLPSTRTILSTGGSHDKFFVGGHPVIVPRHNEIVEYTARGILRTFERMCAEQAGEDR
jgi:hypothetical protein